LGLFFEPFGRPGRFFAAATSTARVGRLEYVDGGGGGGE
jgi:hypothetical protein